MTLATPIYFRQVARVSNAPCPAGSAGLPADPPGRCVYLTGPTVTITQVESLRLTKLENDCKNVIAFVLTAAEGRSVLPLTSALQGPPRKPMAIIVDGRVVTYPLVESAFSTRFEIQLPQVGAHTCRATHARAERLLRELQSR